MEKMQSMDAQLKESDKKQEELKKLIGEAKSTIGRLKQTVNNKQQEIDSFYPVNEVYWLNEYTTKNIAGFQGVLGLKNVSSNYAEVTFANELHKLSVGNYLEVKVRGNKCKIILSEIKYFRSPEEAEFKTVCEKSNNQVNKDASR